MHCNECGAKLKKDGDVIRPAQPAGIYDGESVYCCPACGTKYRTNDRLGVPMSDEQQRIFDVEVDSSIFYDKAP